MYGVGDVAVGVVGDRWTVGVEGWRTGVAGVQFEIIPRRSEKIDATCPSSPPLERAGVVGLLDGRPPGISEGPRFAGSNESVFSGWLIVATPSCYRYSTLLVPCRKKERSELLTIARAHSLIIWGVRGRRVPSG